MARHVSDKIRFHPLDYASALGFIVYAASVTATPMCLVALSHELGFSIGEGGLLESMRSILVILTLLLSGFIAAHFGKARALGWSTLVIAFAMVIYTGTYHFFPLLLALALLGIGGGVIEALLNPLVEELHRGDSGRYLNLLNAFWSVGVLISVLVAGELLTQGISWRYFMAGLSVMGLAAGLLFLLLRNRGAARVRVPMMDVFAHKTALLQNPLFYGFAAMMFMAGAAEGSIMFWSASFIQLHHGGAPRIAGFGVASFSIGMILGRLFCGWWIRQHHLRTAILYSAVIGSLVGLALPFVDRISSVLFVLFLAGLATATFWPSIQAYAVDCMPASDSTSLFILLSCGGIAGFGFASGIIGQLVEYFGFTTALLAIPAFFAMLALLVWFKPRDAQTSTSP